MKFPHVCECPGPGLCPHLGITTTLGIVVHCRGNEQFRWNRSKRPQEEWPESAKTVTHIDGRKFALPVVERRSTLQAAAPSPAPPGRPVCIHRGELSYACGCSSQDKNIYLCGNDRGVDLPHWGRCWNNATPHDDSDVGSCLRCLHYDDGTVGRGTTRRRELRSILRTAATELSGSGRGIVQCVGGSLYTQLGAVTTGVLRDTGCTLPIEWWHLGRHEFDPAMQQLADALGVRVVDASEVAKRVKYAGVLNGYELKAFAIRHCGFAEVLLLDADNVVTADPSYLFDTPEYRQYGAVLWTDLPPSHRTEWITEKAWRVGGLPHLPHVPAVESGQLLVDRRRWGRPLEIALHMNKWSEFWYKHVFGDKDTFPIAWMTDAYFDRDLWPRPKHVELLPYCAPGLPSYVSPKIHQPGLRGELLFQHCVGGKPELISGALASAFVRADAVRVAAAELARLWPGQIWSARDENADERDLAESLHGRWKLMIGEEEHRVRLDGRGRIGDGRTDLLQRWTFRVLQSRPTLIFAGSAHKGSTIGMVFLTPSVGNTWRGRLTAHGRDQVTAEHLT